jgi:putative ABC transport system permease protein
MRFATTLLPAVHALRVHRLRTGLALLGICFGVAAVILIVILGAVTRAGLDAEIRQLGANVMLVLPGPALNKGAWSATGSKPTVDQSDAPAIASELPGIVAAAPSLRVSAQVVYANRNRATTVRGVTPDLFAARPWSVTAGRPLATEDVHRSAKVALIGRGIAKTLFDDQDPTGQIIRIKQVPFSVIGVLEEQGHSLDGDDADDQVLIPLTTARKRILGFFRGHPTAVGGITVRISDAAQMERTSEAIRSLLRERHRLTFNSPDGFVLRDVASAQRAQSRSALLMTLMLASAAAVSLLVGGIGIMNLMLVSVSERRQEIGLRMAIGARPREIGLQFLFEAGLLALLGCIAGVTVAVCGAAVLGAGSAIWNAATGAAIVAAVSAATLITVISALYPARKAARLDPAEALAQDPGGQQDRAKRSVPADTSETSAVLVPQIVDIADVGTVQTDKSLHDFSTASKRKHIRELLEEHGAWLLTLAARKSDLSLRDIQMMLSREKAISVSLGSVWHFYDRHGIRFKKKPVRHRSPSHCNEALDGSAKVSPRNDARESGDALGTRMRLLMRPPPAVRRSRGE